MSRRRREHRSLRTRRRREHRHAISRPLRRHRRARRVERREAWCLLAPWGGALGVVRDAVHRAPRSVASAARHGTWLSSQLVTIGAGRWPASPRQRTEALPLARMTRCVMEACGTEKRSQASGGNCKARHTMYRITFAWQTTTSVVSPTWEGGNQRIISMQSRGSSACTLLLDPPGRAAIRGSSACNQEDHPHALFFSTHLGGRRPRAQLSIRALDALTVELIIGVVRGRRRADHWLREARAPLV